LKEKPIVVKEFVAKKKDYAPLALLLVSTVLLFVSLMLKSMLVIAGLTGVVIAWFLCIDKLIAASRLSFTHRLLLACIAIGLPVIITIYLG
jgi:hypothetical protein